MLVSGDDFNLFASLRADDMKKLIEGLFGARI
jgi:hypothetical protein